MRYLKDKYLIAVSGGPDSMALLDMVRNKGLSINVAHVNYHKRDSAKRDEMIVKSYCDKYQIPFFKLDADKEYQGNFQSYARTVRYLFFKEIIQKQGLNALLVAHHQDDLLETYIMQRDRGVVPSYYGLKRRNVIDGMIVIRPLLFKKKKELKDYCDDNGIDYGIDESNLSDDYERNRIRNHYLNDLDNKKRSALLKEIKDKNRERKLVLDDVKHFIGKQKAFLADTLLSYPYLNDVIRQFTDMNMTNVHVNEIIRQLKSSDNLFITIGDKIIAKEYGKVLFDDCPKDYEYILDSIAYLKDQHFKLAKKGTSFEGVSVSDDDFPLTIRNYHEGDYIMMLYGKKKLSRFFIDHKIPKNERLSYPVMLNKKGEIILVPGLGCDRGHYSIKHNLFMIKL